MKRAVATVITLGALLLSCGEGGSDELKCRSGMKHFCKEWIENCDNSRCDEKDYRKNCHPRIIFICE